jgi:hypothetical protein
MARLLLQLWRADPQWGRWAFSNSSLKARNGGYDAVASESHASVPANKHRHLHRVEMEMVTVEKY